MSYQMVIDPEKWIKISDMKLENVTPYWFKMKNGRIVMGAPFSNGYSSGIASCFVDNDGVQINPNQFYVLRDSFVQPVIYN